MQTFCISLMVPRVSLLVSTFKFIILFSTIPFIYHLINVNFLKKNIENYKYKLHL